jgi:phage portal protein BeeE
MGAIIRAKAGEIVQIGSFANGNGPTRTTWGDPWISRDPGIPLQQYDPLGGRADAETMWKTQPALRKVVTFAARQIGSIPWHAYQRVSDTDRARMQGSPAEQRLNRPGRFTAGFKLWHDIAVDKLMYDLFCVVDINGELVRIPPRLLEIKSDFLGQVRQINLRTPAGEDDVDMTNAPMAISFGWHPNGGSGISPLQTLAGILEENRRSVEWRTQQWDNSPKINGVLKRPAEAPKWGDTPRDRFLNSWRSWRDAPKAGGTPLLEDGMSYEPLEGIKPIDAKDIEGRQLTDAEVASAFHIPPELVGAREGNFSNIAAFRQMLFGPTLGPLFTEIQQAVNNGLVPTLDRTADLYVEMDRDAAINGSFMEQAKLLSTLVGGPVMTRAEGRAKLNLPYLEGTDELITPMNVTEGGQASPLDSGSQNEGDDPEEENPTPD